MGLKDAVARLAACRLHVLLIEIPGHLTLRLAAERACTRRGWHLALSPADADLLITCGSDRAHVEATDLVWDQVPGPRARAELRRHEEVDAVLDQLAAAYVGWSAAADADWPPPPPGPAEHQTDEGNDHAGSGDDRSGHDMGGHDMRGHDMGGPGGIPLASGGEDRDGLEMDQLHVPLGPILAFWPAGVAVRCTLDGDVIADADVSVAESSHVPAELGAVFRLDAAGRLLTLAGNHHSAARAWRIRDTLLDDTASDTAAALADLRRRIVRARLLRWALRGLGAISSEEADRQGWPATWAGDAYDRLLRLLEDAPEARLVTVPVSLLAALPALLPGRELGSARLVIASLIGHPDPAASRDPIPAAARDS